MKFSDLKQHHLIIGIRMLEKRIDQAHCQLLFGDASEDMWAKEMLEESKNDMTILADRFVQLELKRISEKVIRNENS